MSFRTNTTCAVCGDTISGEWLLLNRYGISDGRARWLASVCNTDGDYLWDINEDPDHEDIATGRVLHWPTCATQYIEGRMAEARVESRARGWDK